MTFWKMTQDEEWALSELQNDLIFHKILPADYSYYIQESLKIGKTLASDYRGKDIYEMYKKFSIEIEESKKDRIFGSVRFRAEFISNKGNTKVILYPQSFVELQEASKLYLIEQNQLSIETIKQIHLAHEFYHFLEVYKKEPTQDRLKKVTTINSRLFKRKVGVLRTSEIAAHAFAKNYLDLPVYPTALDYMYLVNQGESNESEVENMLKNNKKKLS